MKHLAILQSEQRTTRSRNWPWYGRKLIYGLAALVLLLAVVSGAEAADEKVFPGAMCVRLGTSQTMSYHGFGVINNPSNATVTVVCPIVRDIVSANYQSVSIVVQDLNPDENVICSVHVVSPTSGSIWHAHPSNPLPPSFSSAALETLNIGP